MKHQYPRLLSVLCALMIATSASWAVPARPGWQTKTQPDGTPIVVQLMGDEFGHYWMTKDGKIAEPQEDGTFVVTYEDIPTGEQMAKRRMASKRFPKNAKMVGAGYMPTRALFILVSFSNQTFKSTSETYYKSKLGDKTDGAMSMYNYLKLQSNGQYAPPVDVYGPYTLSNTYDTYGANDDSGDDVNPAKMIVDACKAADNDIDFSQYDGNNDGKVDNVYVLYAGKGEADGGAASTVWPHQWDIYYGGLTLKLDGKNIRAYACSAELNGSGQCAMGTPLHEFGHVIGLPDYYDTEYASTNYTEKRTPGDWSIMDGGSYNNDGNTPPNYSIFDKYYLGWLTPKFLAKDAIDNVTLTTAYGDGYQITGGTSRVAYSNTNTVYYIENRQKSGWDAYLPGHGMVVWQVKYNATNWNNNNLNNTSGSPRYTVLSASGNPKNIGRPTDPFPGTGTVKTWTPFIGCALTDITESAGNISFKYNGGIDCHAVVTNGTGCTITPSTTCVENGNSFTATITPTDETYDYTSLTVKLGSTTLTSGTHYTLSSDKKTLTVKAAAVTGSASDAFTITAVWTKNRYKYELLGENCTEELSGAVAKNAALNITVTPGAGYTLADAGCWDVSMGGTPLTYGTGFTYNSSTNTFSIASVTGDVEIMAYGSPSVTWYANGNLLTSNVAVGGTLTLPDAPAACPNGKKFVGWTANSSVSGSKPSDLFTSAAGVTVTPGAKYYAVYATQSGSGGVSNDYELYNGALTEGDYLLVYEGGAMNTTVTSDRLGFVSVTATNNVITTTEASIIWHIAASGDYWTIYNAGENKYAAGTGVKNKAQMLADGTDDKSLWSCTSTASSKTYDFTNKQNTASGVNATLRKNGTYGFACYATGTGGALSLYKNVGGGASYSDYSLTCGELCALSSISLNTSSVQKSFAIGATLDYTGLVVTANYSNCSSQTVEPTSVTVSPSMATAGEKTVTVSYTENSVTQTATYSITVVAPYTVTYKACGDVFATQQYAPGAALVLPTETPGDNAEKIFRGWITVEHYTNSNEPTFVTAGGAVNANVTYYAVYE